MITDRRVTPQRWLWKPRRQPIRFIEIHAIRGNTTPDRQLTSALNWVQSPDNGSAAQGWGSSFSKGIGTQGELGVVLDDNQAPTYSAGYGRLLSPGGWSIDEYGISYELAQSPAQEPYTAALYERLVQEVAKDCKRHRIPPVMITVFDQTGPVPAGIVRHDRCENGRKLGSTDPGNQFDEARFIALLRAEMEEEEMLAYEEFKAYMDRWWLEEKPIIQREPGANGTESTPARMMGVAIKHLEKHGHDHPLTGKTGLG